MRYKLHLVDGSVLVVDEEGYQDLLTGQEGAGSAPFAWTRFADGNLVNLHAIAWIEPVA